MINILVLAQGIDCNYREYTEWNQFLYSENNCVLKGLEIAMKQEDKECRKLDYIKDTLNLIYTLTKNVKQRKKFFIGLDGLTGWNGL